MVFYLLRMRIVLEKIQNYGKIEKIQLAWNMPTVKHIDFGFVIFSTHDVALTCECLCSHDRFDVVDELLRKKVGKGMDLGRDMYVVLIDGHCKQGNMEKDHKLKYEMRGKHLGPDLVVYKTLIDALCKIKKIVEADELVQEMIICGLSLDSYIWKDLFDGFYKEGNL